VAELNLEQLNTAVESNSGLPWGGRCGREESTIFKGGLSFPDKESQSYQETGLSSSPSLLF